MMDYSLEKMDAMAVIGQARRFTYDGAYGEIPKFWTEYYEKKLHEQVCGCIGVCFDASDSTDFEYMIGDFCKPDAPVPQGFEKRAIARHLWGKFRSVGPLPGTLQKVTRQIFTDWLPNNAEYSLAEGVSIEWYSAGDMQADDYISEVWVPLQSK